MYEYKTYRGQNKGFLKTVSTDLLIDRFLNFVGEDTIRKVIIKHFSNPELYTISYLTDELFYEE